MSIRTFDSVEETEERFLIRWRRRMPRGVETGVLVVGELQVGKWAADSAAMKADVEARNEPTTTAGVLLYLRTVEKSLEIRRTYL